MRQSSNDLTQMVRLYVSTGQPRYRDYYNEILAIRDGTAPATARLRQLVLGPGPRRGQRASSSTAQPQSLVDQMRAADFTPAGVRRAQRVVARVRHAGPARARRDGPGRRPHRPRASTRPTPPMWRREYQRLVDDAYLAEKGEIMAAIGEFIDLVDQRTLADVERCPRRQPPAVRRPDRASSWSSCW